MMRIMDEAALADVVEQIGRLLAENGHPDRAAWLAPRAEALRSGDPDRAAAARAELRQIINGMGGLNDLHLSAAEDRERLSDLTDSLWILT
jgi:hypothetical protein